MALNLKARPIPLSQLVNLAGESVYHQYMGGDSRFDFPTEWVARVYGVSENDLDREIRKERDRLVELHVACVQEML